MILSTNRTTRRQKKVRSHLRAISSRPRLSVYRSSAHIWAQIIDDAVGTTLAAAVDIGKKGTKIEKATIVGTLIAKAGLKAGVKQVAFDRGSYRYHGRVKALAEAARATGLEF